MNTPTVDILLPTFNRAGYIDAFLKSVATQSQSEWRIIARDDASTDDTQDILDRWQAILGKQMMILPDSGKMNLGCARNFSRLLQASTSPHVMLADPDDIWLPDKIRYTQQAMQELEARVGTSACCLVSTDVSVVDGDLRMIHPSFWRYQGVHPLRQQTMARFLVENSVWGCTIMANRALVERAGSVPDASFHADWWLGLVAASFGHITALPLSTVLWRRHGGNTSEASSIIHRVREAIVNPAIASTRLRKVFRENLERASSFQARYAAQLSESDRETLAAFLSLSSQGPLKRRRLVLRHRLLFTSIRRNLGLLMLI